jgi:hypothetical protein
MLPLPARIDLFGFSLTGDLGHRLSKVIFYAKKFNHGEWRQIVDTIFTRTWDGKLRNALIGNGLGRRRRGNFASTGCPRGAHGVTRPTAIGARRSLSNSVTTSEFGFHGLLVSLKELPNSL